MAINFPIPTQVGEVFTDTSSGNTYTCSSLGPPAEWTSTTNNADLNQTYLRLDASNGPVSGDLGIGGTFASPNITLNANGNEVHRNPTGGMLNDWYRGTTLLNGQPTDRRRYFANGVKVAEVRDGVYYSDSTGGSVGTQFYTTDTAGLTTEDTKLTTFIAHEGIRIGPDMGGGPGSLGLVDGTYLNLTKSGSIGLKGIGNGNTGNPGMFWSGINGGSGNRYGFYEVGDGLLWRCFDTSLKLIARNSGGSTTGVQLSNGANSWSAYVSESRLKDIVGDPDKEQCWNLIRDIELKRYFYKEQDEEFRKGVSYLGPMADWLESQDPELVIYIDPDEEGPIRSFNQGLLDAKALQALSTALTRIEALEAQNTALEARLSALEGA